MNTKASTRLFVILARNAPRAVVFRRGPSKHVRLLTWHTDTDQFDGGQWMKGRIYERRCDLSPNGQWLVYFAANWKPPYQSWTALSRPPYLTARALWPKGDAWGGGGLFKTDSTLALNHYPQNMNVPDNFEVPPHIDIEPLSAPFVDKLNFSPIYQIRLARDGWSQIGEKPQETESEQLNASIWITLDPPLRYARSCPTCPDLTLEMRLRGIKSRNGPWHVLDHQVRRGGDVLVDLPDTDWADWDCAGDLLFAEDGKLFRLDAQSDSPRAADELIDLSDQRFEEIPPPNNGAG